MLDRLNSRAGETIEPTAIRHRSHKDYWFPFGFSSRFGPAVLPALTSGLSFSSLPFLVSVIL